MATTTYDSGALGRPVVRDNRRDFRFFGKKPVASATRDWRRNLFIVYGMLLLCVGFGVYLTILAYTRVSVMQAISGNDTRPTLYGPAHDVVIPPDWVSDFGAVTIYRAAPGTKNLKPAPDLPAASMDLQGPGPVSRGAFGQ